MSFAGQGFTPIARAEYAGYHEWLEQMKRPIAAGYRLKSITTVVAPSRGVMKKSFAKSQSVMNSVARKLETIKPDFGQLDEFAATHHDPGKWDERSE